MTPSLHARAARALLPLAALWFLAALLALPGCILTDDDDDIDNTDFEVSESFFYEVTFDQHVRLDLEAINGDVDIVALPGASSVVVEGERRVGSDSRRDAERHLDDLEVKVRDFGDVVAVRTDQPGDARGRNYVVDYTITLPADLDVDVQHINGEIHIDDVGGDLEVDLVNGTIDCYATEPSGGDVDLGLINGNITVGLPVGTSAELTATVVNGQVSTSNLPLQDLESTPRSVSGRLGDGDGRITLSVVNGNITVTAHD